MIFQNLNQLAGENTNVSPFIAEPNSLFINDGGNNSFKLGALLKDTGYSKMAGTLVTGKSVTGLFDWRPAGAAQKVLATINNSAGTNLTLEYFTNVSTTVDASSAAGQKVLNVADTTGFIAGDSVLIAKGTVKEETKVIDTIQAGISLTMTVNLTNTHTSGTAEQTWTNINVGSTWDGYEDCKVEMENFIGYCFIVGYDATDNVFLPVASLTGTTFSTSANVTSMPMGKYILRYRDRLYVLNCKISTTVYPYSVFQSEIPVAGAITWTPNQIDTGYGEEITGGGVNWDRMMVFTDTRAYMYDGSSFKKVWDRGAYHRTIKNNGEIMVFCDATNVWATTGGQPVSIGDPIIDFIRNGNPSSFIGEMVDEEYHLKVGNVTVNGIAYANCVKIYSFATKTWRTREYYDDFSVLSRVMSSGQQRLYMGSTAGEVMNKAKYTDSVLISSDNGQDISSYFELAPIYVGNLKTEKSIQQLRAYSERGQGLQLLGRTIDTNSHVSSPYKPIGQLKKFIETFDVNIDNGVLLQIAGSEKGKLPYWSFYGFEMDVVEKSKILN